MILVLAKLSEKPLPAGSQAHFHAPPVYSSATCGAQEAFFRFFAVPDQAGRSATVKRSRRSIDMEELHAPLKENDDRREREDRSLKCQRVHPCEGHGDALFFSA